MTELFIKILNMSITASYVALVVLLVRIFLKKSPKIFSYMLWSVVLFRLISPLDFGSSLSLLKPLNKSSNYIPQNVGMMESPKIITNIETIDSVANNSLPAATPYASVEPMQILLNLFTFIWILGMAVLVIYSTYSYFKVHRKTQFATLIKENIYETDQIVTPFVFGFIRPKIYLPKGLQSNELNYIINHERTHVRRYDYLIKPISFLVLTLHWFNPVMWFCYYLMIRDMEMSCDESVLKKSGGDLRGSYSSSLLNLSVKQSRLLLPLAFGESNIKSRIKNVLNYKRPSFWSIFIPIIIVIVISIGLLTNPMDDSAKDRAEEFLRTYYTIENTDIADKLHDPEFRDINEKIREKHGELMTENALNRVIANRVILDGEIAAREYGSRLEPKSISISLGEEHTTNDPFQYHIYALVKFQDGSEELVNLFGTLVMEEVEGKWKVRDFQFDQEELANVLQFGKSYLFITNHSSAPIRRVEFDARGHSGGTMNADNTDLEKNARVDFEIIDAENLQFVVKLLDKNNNTLLQQSFAGDFSKGKDVYLYIQEDYDGKLMINDKNSKDKKVNLLLPPEKDTELTYRTSNLIYLNDGSTSYSLGAIGPTFTFSKEELSIKDGGDIQSFEISYDEKPLTIESFQSQFQKWYKIPDISSYKNLSQYDLCKSTKELPGYRLYVLDDQYWMGTLYRGSVWRIVSIDIDK